MVFNTIRIVTYCQDTRRIIQESLTQDQPRVSRCVDVPAEYGSQLKNRELHIATRGRKGASLDALESTSQPAGCAVAIAQSLPRDP